MRADSIDQRISPAPLHRAQPLVVLVVTFGAGIATDRYLPLPMLAWIAIAGVALAAWSCAFRLRWTRASALGLLATAAAIGGARHHDRWFLFPADEIGRAASGRSQPICLEAVALTSPTRVPAPPPDPMQAIPVGDRSVLKIRVARVRNGRRWQSASGEAELSVDGHLLGVAAGDRIRLFAMFRKPTPQENPGEFDVAGHRRSQRQLIQLHAAFPDAVTVIARGSMWNWRRCVATVRTGCHDQLWSHLGQRQAALASAVLLGAREQLNWERTQAFVTTGTVHLLAISGLHVGILAYGFWWIARLLPIGRRSTVIAAALFVVLYALLTASRPPVLRATVLIVAFCLARLTGRRTAGYNVLAAAALVLLAWNPSNLFQPGAQLSFLAVATVFFVGPYLVPDSVDDPLDRLIIQSRPWFFRLWRRVRGSIGVVVAFSVCIWMVALPLTMYRYHLFSPIAVVLNPIVCIPIAVALLSGFCILIFGWLLPPIATVCGWLCNSSLRVVEALVDYASGIRWGHFWTPGPPLWWVIGFYGGCAVYLSLLRGRVPARWCLATLAIWLAAGAASCGYHDGLLAGNEPRPLECTFLSVGHGGCTLLELPEGQTLLYDAGRMGLPGRAIRGISSTLWSRGIRHLDAVVISHADTDHFNALPQLTERFSVGVVFVSPVMFDTDDEAVAALRAAIEQRNIPIQEIYAGDRLTTPGAVQLEILHPLRRGTAGGDNANSVVLRVDYCGRTILLPGDLEGQGLEDLIAEEPIDCDVLLTPHHGSIRSDPAGITRWCKPQWAIISGAIEDGGGPAEQVYTMAGARVLHTARSGAVRVSIDRKRADVRAWGEQPW
jgi:competence protein ComEC